MLGLKLRNEFLGTHMPGTAISLRTNDNQGAVQKSADSILSITYPTADVLTALKSISIKRNGRPVVLLGDRGRGKSHIMAVMHHAIASPEIVENWTRDWSERTGDKCLNDISMVKGFLPISEPVHNHEYQLLWDLLFERHPKGQYYRGQFESLNQPFPPRTLLEKMFEEQPVCLILDEFQTWFNGLPEKDYRTGYMLRQWAFNFIQILSEIAKDRPEILILVISVLNNQNEAFQQVHRQGPVIIDFRGPTAKRDRQKLLLHRLFQNRSNFSEQDISSVAELYASERIRLLFDDRPNDEKDRFFKEVYSCWPFSPELVELLEDQILLSQVAQETRDLIRILAQVYRSRGESVPVITSADFFVDGETDDVQTLVDSIAVHGSQDKLREIAQRNLQSLLYTGADIPHARELISAIWMRSISPGKTAGGTPAALHLDITRGQIIDDNSFQAELNLLIENSINIHGDEVPGGPLWFGLLENPRSKVKTNAKNHKLWQYNEVSSGGQSVYPGKDIEHVRKTLRHLLAGPDTKQLPVRIVVPGPNWQTDPWSDVLEESDKPSQWQQPVLFVIPEPIVGGGTGINAVLGMWLAEHVKKRRNTVRFLLHLADMNGLYSDPELLFCARCSFLCSKDAWGMDPVYYNLHRDFDRQLWQALGSRFNRFAILRTWNFQNPDECIFEIEKFSEQGSDIALAIESRIVSTLFDPVEFLNYIISRARDADFVGSILDDLMEPPPPDTGDAIPFLGETAIYENILKIAAKGNIVLNVGGTWIGRRGEDNSDDDALRYVKQKAFRTGLEMRQVQLGLPAAVGGGTVTAPCKPKPGPEAIPQTQIQGVEPSENLIDSGQSKGEISPPTETHPPNVFEEEIRHFKSSEPANGINLSGCFEAWGVPSTENIDTATIEFKGLTVQQVKQILQRIPSSFKGTLAVSWREGEKKS